ncbi:MAG: NusG domain II-containing protein [Deltaproteobacteria bacterium]|uniref:NusG domain II-containing protein n=1 Tax=Candidatus Zymogenus saltonus TaxID=2844893 RepID=A0A9D8KGR8_9DELT|nr:NusG domain II-containing protein [Candidatus Zymogenus saltonus]
MFTRADKILIVALIVVSALSYPAIRHFFSGGTFVSIEVSGEERRVVRLGLDKEITVPGKIGDSVIRFDEKGVRFVDSPCVDKNCIEAGRIKKEGEVLRCEANDVTVRIIGANGKSAKGRGIDFITR